MNDDYNGPTSRSSSGAELACLMHAEARDLLASRIERAVLQRRSIQDREGRAMRLTHDAVSRILEADNHYRTGVAQLWNDTIQSLSPADQSARIDSHARDRQFTDGAALKLLGGELRADMMVRQNHIDVFGPPYANSWKHLEGAGTPHEWQHVWANAGTGEIGFDYRIFPKRGTLFCGAAVWVNFMRRAPGFPPGYGTPGGVEVRTYAPYNYMWHNMSAMESAHSEAGFGVYVLSWDLNGNDRVVEQDHIDDLIWNNTTDWNWNRGNQSFPDTDYDVPLQFPHPPAFPIRPGRFYSAAIWCFGSASAAGQLSEHRASLSESRLAAKVVFVVVDQQ